MTDVIALVNLSISEAAAALRRGETTSVALTEATLARIDQTEPTLQAYATVPADLALAAAEQADRDLAAGRDRGPLQGIPIGVKDNCYTKGIATEVGSRVFAGHVPDYDATVVEKLYAAGAVIIGQNALPRIFLRRQRAADAHALGPGTISRRQQHRLGSGAGGALGFRGHRHGHRWFNSHSGIDQQSGWHESDLRPGKRSWRRAAGLVARSCRALKRAGCATTR